MISARSKSLRSELARLNAGLKRAELRNLWRQVYGAEPPESASPQLLTQAIGYRLQVKALGGLSFHARRALERASEEVDSSGRQRIEPGVVLVRVWHGTSHKVTALKDGVEYQGKRYRSLSEVARLITKARWSGPRFFLGSRAAEKTRVAR